MREDQIGKMVGIVEKHIHTNGMLNTPISSLQIFRTDTGNLPTPTVFNPSICLLIQGKKQAILHEEIYHYSSSEFLIISVDLPIIGKVTMASKSKPYLSIKLDIDFSILSEILLSMSYRQDQHTQSHFGLNIGKADEKMGDAIIRLLSMLDAPEEIPLFSNAVLREIYYRVLCSQYGAQLAQLAIKGSHVHRISNAISKIKNEYRESIQIEDLAKVAGMSLSSFYANFKSVTSMSPLQFQKKLRLIDARSLMLSGELDATTAAYHVGYESPSQFNREYARFFGNPPRRDINELKSSIA